MEDKVVTPVAAPAHETPDWLLNWRRQQEAQKERREKEKQRATMRAAMRDSMKQWTAWFDATYMAAGPQ